MKWLWLAGAFFLLGGLIKMTALIDYRCPVQRDFAAIILNGVPQRPLELTELATDVARTFRQATDGEVAIDAMLHRVAIPLFSRHLQSFSVIKRSLRYAVCYMYYAARSLGRIGRGSSAGGPSFPTHVA